MIPYAKQHIDSKDVQAVTQAVRSDWLTQGPAVAAFEKAIAQYCGVTYAVAVSNGTAALHCAYLAAGLQKGDEVITTPNTFVATTNMLLAVGAKPVFCDIRADTFNIDEQHIEDHITQKTAAIVPVHIAGQSCDMQSIKKIAKRHRLLVIEDACHAFGAKHHNTPVGSCTYSDMTVFSFHAIKAITTAEGGIITTNNKKLYNKLLLLRSHGITKDARGFNVMKSFGYNYRLTDMQAALGISQLKKIDTLISKRRALVKHYDRELRSVEEIILPQELPQNYSGWHLYVIQTKKKSDRMPLYRHLQSSGVGVNFHYPAVYSHPYYREHGYAKIQLPEMDVYNDTAITLPLHPLLTKKEITHISNAIKNFYAA